MSVRRPGPKRIRDVPWKLTAVRIDERLTDRIDEFCAARGISKRVFFEAAVARELERDWSGHSGQTALPIETQQAS